MSKTPKKKPAVQSRIRRTDHLKPWQFQPGKSGNPDGKPKGTISLKKFAQKYIQELSDEEKIEYLTGIDKKTVWEMAEDKPKQATDVRGTLTISQVLDQLENGSASEGQELEDKQPLQDTEQGG